ncbi:MAG TPA: amidohydrolase family protein [Candidatus Gastranaerophilales bacterium]|nr:amidohydrolase family protein [Candidatus Gastranaerophilales bacterium]
MAVQQQIQTKIDLITKPLSPVIKKSINRENVLKDLIIEGINKKGGFVNTHAHLDRAYTVNLENFHLAKATLKEKWFLVDSIKRNSSVYQIYDRMSYALERMVEQNVQAVGTFIDVDEVVGDKCIKAAQLLKEQVSSDIQVKFINQALKGVINPESRKWFDLGAEFVDIIGGLPAKDEGHEEEHLDILMQTAKKYNKPVHVHVDQLNTASEKETELLAKKTIEHGLEGRVSAIHSISVAAQNREYRQELYKLIKKAKLNIICCPTAWIDGRRTEELAPTHNSVTPVDEMIPAGIPVAIGTDNIADILKPFTDGDMWTEVRFLLESCRFYNIEELINISTVNGLKVLEIPYIQ